MENIIVTLKNIFTIINKLSMMNNNMYAKKTSFRGDVTSIKDTMDQVQVQSINQINSIRLVQKRYK